MVKPVGKASKTTQTKRQKTVFKKDTDKTQKEQNTQKITPKKHYSVDSDGKKTDVTSIFNQIEENSKQDKKDHDNFMQDMFGDVL